MRIEHVAFNVTEATAQTQWHVQHLGMRVVRAVGDPNQTHFMVDASGNAMVELYSNPAVPVPDYAGMSVFALHIAFAVDDLQAEVDRLLAAGASIDGDIYESPAGDRMAFLRDPWGLTLQLWQRVQPMLPPARA